MADKKASSVKTISLVMVLMLIGKLLGLLRDSLMTTYFGSGMETNAFMAASQIPRNFFDIVFAAAITSSFIPVFSEYVAKKGKRDAVEFAGNFITVMALLSFVLTILGIVLTGPLVKLFVPGFDETTAALCVSLTRVMFPTVFFTGIAYCFVGILQSFDEFNIPALISVIMNLIIIVYYFTFNSKFGIYGLAGAYLIGYFVQAAVQTPSLVRKRFRFQPSFSFRSEGIKKVFALMVPALISTWVQPINLTINTNFGSRLYNGTGVTAINLANNLYVIVVGVFILSVTNVIFPRLSRLTAKNETAQFKDMLSATVHASMYFVIPMTAGLMVLARPVISLVYGWGKFDDFAVTVTSQALTFVSLGMIGYALQAVLSRACFARQNGRIPLIAGLASIAVNLLLSVLLTGPLGVTGLAIASAAAATVNAVVLIIPLELRNEGFLSRKFVLDFVKMTASALIMSAVVWGILQVFAGMGEGFVRKAVTAVVPAAAGVAVYFAATALFGLSEAKSAAAIAARLLPARRKTESD